MWWVFFLSAERGDISLLALDMAEARVEEEEESLREAREAGGARRNPRAPMAAASGERFRWRASFTFHPHYYRLLIPCACVERCWGKQLGEQLLKLLSRL